MQNTQKINGEFFNKLTTFCDRYGHMEGLRESADRIINRYKEQGMLRPDLNATAAKCHFEEDPPKDLIQAIDMLFKRRGEHLIKGTAITDFMLIKAIGWIGHNIASHVDALQLLIALEEQDK